MNRPGRDCQRQSSHIAYHRYLDRYAIQTVTVPSGFVGDVVAVFGAVLVQLRHKFEHLMCLQVLYRYNDGMYGLYPQTIGAGGAPLTFEAGVLLESGKFWRYTAKYSGDRSVDRITWEIYNLAD